MTSPSTHYFTTIAPIWSAFLAKNISMAERDRLLEHYRRALYKEQTAS